MCNLRIWLSAIAVTIFGLSYPASAGEQPETQSLDMVVHGLIAEQCALGSIGNLDFGNLERRGLGSETHVAFYCNIPFTMMIKSAHGALTHTTLPNGQGPFGGALPYSMEVGIPLRNPSKRQFSQVFSSRQLFAGGIINSNGSIATDGMVLGIELGRPTGEAGLLGGDYSETITITVSAI